MPVRSKAEETQQRVRNTPADLTCLLLLHQIERTKEYFKWTVGGRIKDWISLDNNVRSSPVIGRAPCVHFVVRNVGRETGGVVAAVCTGGGEDLLKWFIQEGYAMSRFGPCNCSLHRHVMYSDRPQGCERVLRILCISNHLALTNAICTRCTCDNVSSTHITYNEFERGSFKTYVWQVYEATKI